MLFDLHNLRRGNGEGGKGWIERERVKGRENRGKRGAIKKRIISFERCMDGQMLKVARIQKTHRKSNAKKKSLLSCRSNHFSNGF